MSALNPLPRDFQSTVLVLEEGGAIRLRRDDEITGLSSFHQHYIIARAISVSGSMHTSDGVLHDEFPFQISADMCVLFVHCFVLGLLVLLVAGQRRNVFGEHPGDV